jgi:hypothetical protein
MKVESSVQLLLPSVPYGNLTIFTKVSLDSEQDYAVQRMSSEEIQQRARELVLEEIQNMKREIDKTLTASTYKLENVK